MAGKGSCTEEMTAHKISSVYVSGGNSDLAEGCLEEADHEEVKSMVSATIAPNSESWDLPCPGVR